MRIFLNLPASCCNFTGRNVLHIKISAKFDVDFYVTFLNFQTSSMLSGLMNVIALQKLHAFIKTLQNCSPHPNLRQISTLTVVWPFRTAKTNSRSHGWKAVTPCEHNNSLEIACFILLLLLRCFPYENHKRIWHWPLCSLCELSG